MATPTKSAKPKKPAPAAPKPLDTTASSRDDAPAEDSADVFQNVLLRVKDQEPTMTLRKSQSEKKRPGRNSRLRSGGNHGRDRGKDIRSETGSREDPERAFG